MKTLVKSSSVPLNETLLAANNVTLLSSADSSKEASSEENAESRNSSSSVSYVEYNRKSVVIDNNSLNNQNKRPCIDYNPCRHGQCKLSNSTGDFTCECNVGYMGPFCDLIRHPCDFKPCENGICEIVGDLYYKCLCKPNYTGINCHIGRQAHLFHIAMKPVYSMLFILKKSNLADQARA
jgi:hypothetical protein